MKQKLLLIFTAVFCLVCMSACSGSNDYSETYIIVHNGKRVGKEIINERTDIKGNLICLAEQERDSGTNSKDKKKRIVRTKMVIPKGELFPTSYSYESNTGTSFNIKVEGGKIIKTLKNKGEDLETITPLKSGLLMLDLSAFHTITYWFSKYNINKKGPQVFQTYFPQSASIEPVSVIPSEAISFVHKLQIKNYEIQIDNELKILLWMDKENRLYRMQGPNVDVIQSDLFDRLNKKMNRENENS